MKINELSQQTGLTVPTLRFYEKEGLLTERYVSRSANNYRDYGSETVSHLLLVKKMQSAGFTLSEIKELLRAYEEQSLSLRQALTIFVQKMQEIDAKHEELNQIQLRLERMFVHKMGLLEDGNRRDASLSE